MSFLQPLKQQAQAVHTLAVQASDVTTARFDDLVKAIAAQTSRWG